VETSGARRALRLAASKLALATQVIERESDGYAS